jgi:hypothetical protein
MITNNFRDLLYIAIANETLICDNGVFYGKKKIRLHEGTYQEDKNQISGFLFLKNQINDFIK